MQKENSVGDLREKLRGSGSRTSISSKAPKLCKVCSRASFLKCMECDTIYCSSKCQIKDWENHQYQHLKMASSQSIQKNPMQQRASNIKHESVQNRLKVAVNKEPSKMNIDEQIKRIDQFEQMSPPPAQRQQAREPIAPSTAMDVDEITSNMNAIELAENPHPFAEEESFISQTIRAMMNARKFKRHVELDQEWKDNEGYSFVTVTEVEKKPEGSTFYWVMPKEVKESYIEFKQGLDETYSNDEMPLISMEELSQFKRHMVIAKINNEWVRASILNISSADNVVGLEDIDSGRKVINVLPRDLIKIPLEQEMHKSTYAFKVIFENLLDDTLEIGDVVKLRITQTVPYAFHWAELKLEGSSPEPDKMSEASKPTTSENNERQANEMAAAKEKEKEAAGKWKRYTIDDVQVKDMHVGPNVKLLFVDGSNLEKGFLHLCESLKENWEFFDKLGFEIAEYVAANPSAAKYKPVVRELVLAKFTDNAYYRAVCINTSEFDAKLVFIDYGSVHVADLTDVMQLPAKMLHTCCSHSCTIKLASDRPISSLDFEESRDLLLNKNEFEASVEKQDKKYFVTLDDSLVAHKL